MITMDRVPASMTIRSVVSTQIVKYDRLYQSLLFIGSLIASSDCTFSDTVRGMCLLPNVVSLSSPSLNRKSLTKVIEITLPIRRFCMAHLRFICLFATPCISVWVSTDNSYHANAHVCVYMCIYVCVYVCV